MRPVTAAVVLATALALSGCAGSATRDLVASDSMQSAAVTVLVARAIERTSDPQASARAVLTFAEVTAVGVDPAVIDSAVRAHLGYADRPASERVLIDAVAQALAADLAAVSAEYVPATAERWRVAVATAARAVLAG